MAEDKGQGVSARRCGLKLRHWHQLIEIALPHYNRTQSDNHAPACARITIKHWSEHPGSVRPFFRAFGLGHNGADYVGGLASTT